jgi:DNA mismatch repair protein MutS
MSSAPAKTPTPFMRQWERAKSQYPDTLLLFRMGDFYELFGEDAKIMARECEITLTARNKEKADAIPMCGVPYHSIERHIALLLSRGYRVAVCEQMEDPKYARGLVKREVVRVLSPGTILEDSYLSGVGASTGNNFLAALSCDAKLSKFGISLVDISTGEFFAGEVEGASTKENPCETDVDESGSGLDVTPEAAESTARFAKLREELLRFAPSEILVPQRLRECPGFLAMLGDLKLNTTAFDASGFDTPREKLLRHFKTMSLRGFGLEEFHFAQEAAALTLDYLKESHLGALGHLRRITLLATDGWMILDNATRRNLELAQSLRDGSSKGTLLALLDETRTGAGARLLRKWVLQPLLSKERIERRQDAIQELRDNLLLRRDCRDLLKSVGDIERLVARAVAGTGNARDLVALRNALLTLPAIQLALKRRARRLWNTSPNI